MNLCLKMVWKDLDIIGTCFLRQCLKRLFAKAGTLFL